MNDQLVRCFIAIKLPDEVRTQIESQIQELNHFTKMVRWIKADSLHLTLKFLGEIEADRVEQVKSTLERVKGVVPPFDLRFNGSGCFPGRKRPRVFWLGLDKEGVVPLSELQSWLEDQLWQVGFEKENRKFTPHLTIARVKGDENFSDLYSYIDNHLFTGKKFNVDKIYLIRSYLRPTGAAYKELASFSL
jgi:2'-5' RNA ligase